jgi:hypothetical protein
VLPLWERQVASSHRRRVPPPGRPNVAIITAMPPDACRHVKACHSVASWCRLKTFRSRAAMWRLQTVQMGPWVPAVRVLICKTCCLQLPHSGPLQLAGGDQQAGLCAAPWLGAAPVRRKCRPRCCGEPQSPWLHSHCEVLGAAIENPVKASGTGMRYKYNVTSSRPLHPAMICRATTTRWHSFGRRSPRPPVMMLSGSGGRTPTHSSQVESSTPTNWCSQSAQGAAMWHVTALQYMLPVPCRYALRVPFRPLQGTRPGGVGPARACCKGRHGR